MVEIKNLTKKYGDNLAVDNISFTVSKGEILGFLGPNGAGKSTTMNILTGYLSCTDGEVKIDGYDILDNPIESKKRIGYLPEHPPLYMDMTVAEYLDFVYELKGVKEDRAEHLGKIMEAVKITDVKDRLIANLSKGYKQRVGLAQAMVGNPEVLILDEPTVGLDPKQIIEIRDVIKKLGREHTVILSSHILQEVNAICERVIIINKGRLVASDTAENLGKSISNENKFQLRVSGDERSILDALEGISGIKYIKSLGRKEAGSIDFVIEAEPNVDVRTPIFNALAQNGLPILAMQAMDLSLEDIFLEVTQNSTDVNAVYENVSEDEIELVGSSKDAKEFEEVKAAEQAKEATVAEVAHPAEPAEAAEPAPVAEPAHKAQEEEGEE
ncbi:MAG: ATP-binding cassette domain-containing protein [Clostridia bacterium]|nr:ATP-binding cassette domain-containing protein [Clostridia bacterium]